MKSYIELHQTARNASLIPTINSLSSHAQLVDMVGPPPRKILDLGCGTGELAHVLKERGYYVVGLDREPPQYKLDQFVYGNIEDGIPLPVEEKFDTILLADVLEHLEDPLRILVAAKERLTPSGVALVSLPNAVHWSVRAQVLSGRFDYTTKGILDRGHLRFFTLESARRLFGDAGFQVASYRTTPIPWENILPRLLTRPVIGTIEKSDYLLTQLRPNFFAYQNIFELVQQPPAPDPHQRAGSTE